MKMIAFDVETRGLRGYSEYALQPYRLGRHQAEVTSFALAWYGQTENERPALSTRAVRNPTREDHARFLNHAYESGLTIVGWGVTFDAAWLIADGLRVEAMRCKWLDAMLLWQHLERMPEYGSSQEKRRSWSLKTAVAKYMPAYAGYDEGVDFEAMDEASIRKRLRYNRMDAGFSLVLADRFLRELNQQDPRQLRNALIEAATIPLVADSTVGGLQVDTAAAQRLDDTLAHRIADLGEKLDEHGATGKILRSPVQLRKLLYETWDLPVTHYTDKGAPSTDKAALYYLAAEDQRAWWIKEYREHVGNRKKFVDNIQESVAYNEDGKTRPTMRIYGTYTGRATFASKQGRNKDVRQTGFAIHQMKSAPEFRRLIEAPPGYVLCELDAAGQEYRWMAVESGDETMRGLCQPGEDPHAYMGAGIAHEDYAELARRAKFDPDAKQHRQMGKVGNLSCVAANTEILTHHGVKRIVDVTLDDMVWDGEDFVSHEGVVFNGYREVISYQGLTATADHKVLCGGEWFEFGHAAAEGRAIDPAGWGVDDRRRGDSELERSNQNSLSLSLRCRAHGGDQHVSAWSKSRMRGLQGLEDPCSTGAHGATESSGEAGAPPRLRDAAAMQQPPEQIVQELRRSGDPVQVSIYEGGNRVHLEQPTSRDIRRLGYRSGGQRRALRGRQPPAGSSTHEPTQHALQYPCDVARKGDPFAGLAGKPVCPHHGRQVRKPGAEWRGDTAESKAGCSEPQEGVAEDRGKVAVYDILNCGPRNRFGANNLIVHNCQFRIGPKKLRLQANVQFGMPITHYDAAHIHRTYHQTYPGVRQYWTRQIAKCHRKGYAETLAGRRVTLPNQWNDRDVRWMLESTAVNFPIQGIGADQKYLAMKVLSNYLPGMGGYFYFELHDGIYFILPEKTAYRDALRLRNKLSNLPYQKAWGFTPPVPLPWDLKMGYSWGDMMEFN